MKRYTIISDEDALRYLMARQLNDDSVQLEDIRHTAGSGDEMPDLPLTQLRAKLLKLKKKFPEKLRKKDPQGGKFEADACGIVHECLSAIDKQALADHGFWIFLAVDFLADILEWRFGTDGGPAQFANYGLGAKTENMFLRLWLRAELGKTIGTDPYALAKSGDQDLWRSHVLRQGYS